MGVYTPRLGLYKPAVTENVNVETQLNANYNILDNCVLYNAPQTITANWTFSGNVTLSNLGAGSTDTVVVHSNGLLRTRTIDSRVWGSSLVGYSSSGSNYIAKFSGTNTITSSVIYESNGNLGIGVTSPTSKLHFASSTSSAGGIAFGDDIKIFRSGANELNIYAYDVKIGESTTQSNVSLVLRTYPEYSQTIYFLESDTSGAFIRYDGGGNNLCLGMKTTSGERNSVVIARDTGDMQIIGKIGLNTTPNVSHLFYDYYLENPAESNPVTTQSNRFRSVVTTSGTYYKIGLIVTSEMSIAPEVSNPGYLRGIYIQAWRNSISGISDSGSLTSISGIYIQYGHFNTNSSETPQTSNAYGIYIEPRALTGTITNLYGLYLATRIGTGSTNYWAIYQADSSAINEFYGRITNRHPGSESNFAFMQLRTTFGTYYCIGTYVDDETYKPRFYIAHTSTSSPLRHYVTFGSTFYSTIGYADWIFSSGNVGIGTTTPSSKLTVAGTHSGTLVDLLRLQTTGTTPNTETGICFYEASVLVGRMSLCDKGTETMMSLSTYNNPNILNIRGNKVGINTTEPTSVLDVYSATGFTQLRLRTTYTPTGSNDSNGQVGSIAWDDNYIYIKTSSGWKRASLSNF